jgi:hypothetical protein
VAPFDPWYQPNYDFMDVYHPEFTAMNAYRGGYQQQDYLGMFLVRLF